MCLVSQNTRIRFVSALMIVLTIFISFIFGGKLSMIMWCLSGLVVVDELYVNFLRKERWCDDYKKMVLIYLLFVVAQLFHLGSVFFDVFIIFASFLINCFLIFFLFTKNHQLISKVTEQLKAKSYLISITIAIQFCCFSQLFLDYSEWRKIIIGFIVIGATTDSFAWLIGRKFGKKKLMPSISPNKTIEGAIGGITGCLIASSLYWFFIMDKLNIGVILSLITLSILAMIGDLIESKMKRLFSLKDSSNLIPGHGGVYDRLDSYIMMSPFFVFMINWGFLF